MKINTFVAAYFLRSIKMIGYWLDGDWDTIAFVAEHPDNPFLTRWGWWDK